MINNKVDFVDPNLGKQKILATPIADISKSFMENMFAGHFDKSDNQFHESSFLPEMPITLTKKEYPFLKTESIKTTLGMLMFNRLVLEKINIIQHTGYYNKTLTKKGVSKLDIIVNNLVVDDIISTIDLGNYVDMMDKCGFWAVSYLSPSITAGLVDPMEDVNKRKKELFKEYEKDLASTNPVTQILASNKIEKELMGMVRENLKDDVGKDLYDSGVGNLDNNYKTINVMRGAVINNITGRYDVVKSSLMDGLTKHDLTGYANSVVAGAYPSAVGTAEAGYMSKQILALLQSEHVNPDIKSDCGTKSTIIFTITEKNKQYALFRNIDVDGKMVMTNLTNIDSFVGKTVRMYSPQCCLDDAICCKCAGKVFHNLGATNVGLLVTQVTQKLLNLKLKSKHDLSQSAAVLRADQIFLHKTKYCITDGLVLKNKATMKMFIPKIKTDSGEEGDLIGFVKESSFIQCLGVFPVKFYDNNDNEIDSDLMINPNIVTFNLYSDVQEDVDNYIVTYDPDSVIMNMDMRQSLVNVEVYLKSIFLYSRIPMVDYNLITELMFKCLELNGIDLDGPSITYELLARRTCRKGNDTFAKVYGADPNVDQMSYEKYNFRTLVQKSGILQGMLFEDVSASLKVGLSQSLNGIKPTPTPLERIIKA